MGRSWEPIDFLHPSIRLPGNHRKRDESFEGRDVFPLLLPSSPLSTPFFFFLIREGEKEARDSDEGGGGETGSEAEAVSHGDGCACVRARHGL